VFVATGAARPVLDRALLEPVLRARRGAPLLVMDLAVPPNVAADVRTAPGVLVLDLDVLPASVPASVVAESEALVADEVDACLQELLVRSTAPRLSELHQEGESLVSEELVRTFGALGPLSAEVQEEIERLAHRLARRLLFPASHAVRDVAREAWPPFPTCSGCQRTHLPEHLAIEP
jgi:glutamyl-tRNA reductase